MKLISTIGRAARGLKQSKGRTILTSLSIGVGAFTIALALGAGNGLRVVSEQLITTNFNTQQIFVTPKGNVSETPGAESNADAPKEYSEVKRDAMTDRELLSQEDIDKIAKIPEVERVEKTTSIQALYLVSEKNDKKFQTGIGADTQMAPSQRLAAGEFNGSLKDNQAVVPEGYLESLGFANAQEAIGKKITVTFQKIATVATGSPQQFTQEFTIAAVSQKETLAANPVTNQIVIAYQKTQEIAKLQNEGIPGADSSAFLIAYLKKYDTPEDRAAGKAAIEASGRYFAGTADDVQKALFTVVNVIQYVVIGFGAISLIAAVFGIINTQYISVLERTKEIGLYKALGMRNKSVLRLFQFEAAWIGFLGGVVGTVFAGIAMVILNPILANLLSIDTPIIQFIWWQVGALIIGLSVLAILAGYFPARKAAKLDPIEALRTE